MNHAQESIKTFENRGLVVQKENTMAMANNITSLNERKKELIGSINASKFNNEHILNLELQIKNLRKDIKVQTVNS